MSALPHLEQHSANPIHPPASRRIRWFILPYSFRQASFGQGSKNFFPVPLPQLSQPPQLSRGETGALALLVRYAIVTRAGYLLSSGAPEVIAAYRPGPGHRLACLGVIASDL